MHVLYPISQSSRWPIKVGISVVRGISSIGNMFHSRPQSQSSSLVNFGLLLTFVLAFVGVKGDYDWYGDYTGSELDYIFADVNFDAVCPPGGYAVCASDGYNYHPFSSKCRLDSQNLKLLFAGKKGKFSLFLTFFSHSTLFAIIWPNF